MKNLFKNAHKLTKEMVEKYGDVDYQAQFGLFVSFLIEEEKRMKKLKGTEKQAKWGEEILKEIKETLNEALEGSNKIYKKEKSIEIIKVRVQKAEEFINQFTNAGDVIDKFKSISYKKGVDKIETIAFLTDIELPKKLVEYVDVALNNEIEDEVEFNKFGKDIKIKATKEGLIISVNDVEGKAGVVKENGVYHYTTDDKDIMMELAGKTIPLAKITHKSAKAMQVYL